MIPHNITQVGATPRLHSMTNIPKEMHRLTPPQASCQGERWQIHLPPAPAGHSAFVLPLPRGLVSLAPAGTQALEGSAQAVGMEGSGSIHDCAVRPGRLELSARMPAGRSGQDSRALSSSRHASGH